MAKGTIANTPLPTIMIRNRACDLFCKVQDDIWKDQSILNTALPTCAPTTIIDSLVSVYTHTCVSAHRIVTSMYATYMGATFVYI